MKLIINTDGGSRGNPGPAGIGAVIRFEDFESEKLKEISKYIGDATNNQAEYTAVLEALNYIVENHKTDEPEMEFRLDSQLVVEQLKGNYKLKNEGLKPLFWQIRDLIMELGGKASFTHIPREENSQADKLVNEALDKAMENKNGV